MPSPRPSPAVVKDFSKAVKARARAASADPFIRAQHAQADALHALAAAIDRATVTLDPAAKTIAGLGERLDGLCLFLKNKGPWLLASVPGVLVAIQAISPQAAKGLAALLQALGSQ